MINTTPLTQIPLSLNVRQVFPRIFIPMPLKLWSTLRHPYKFVHKMSSTSLDSFLVLLFLTMSISWRRLSTIGWGRGGIPQWLIRARVSFVSEVYLIDKAKVFAEPLAINESFFSSFFSFLKIALSSFSPSQYHSLPCFSPLVTCAYILCLNRWMNECMTT